MLEDMEDIISISDEDGNEFNLVILDEADLDGVHYLALTEAENPEEEENLEVIILKQFADEATGETMLSTVDSDDELARIYEVFEERMFADDEDLPADEDD